MSFQNEKSQIFLKYFEKQIIQGRKLLKAGNHRWADKLLTNLYFEIKKADWINLQKKDQLYAIINNSWDKYLQSLVQQNKEDFTFDVIRYYDSYNRFFGFLAKQGNYYEVIRLGKDLVKSYINQPNISIPGLIKFINSLSDLIKDEGNYHELLKYQIITIYLLKSVSLSATYYFSMNFLWEFLKNVEPSKRSLLLYIFLENIGISYQLKENSEDFVREIRNIMKIKLSPELKNEFSLLSRIKIDENNFSRVFTDLESLLMYLNDIGESRWILSLIENIFIKIIQYNNLDDAVEYVRKYIHFLIERNRFEISFNIYKFLGEYFKEHIKEDYNFSLIEHWSDACKHFRGLKENKYLLRSLEELQQSISTPTELKQIFHYFHLSNFIWRLKTEFLTSEKFEFWNMIFYRAFFEEEDLNLSEMIIKFLPKKIQPLLTNLQELLNNFKQVQESIVFLDQKNERLPPIFNEKKNAKIIILSIRIKNNGEIRFYGKFDDSQEFQDVIKDEYWNDTYLTKIYNDLFWNKKVKTDLNTIDFGRLLYLMLPRKLKLLFLKLNIEDLDYVPQIYLILDNMTIPFDLINDGGGIFSLKFSIGYSIGEPNLKRIISEKEILSLSQPKQKKYNALVIGCLNLMLPSKWDDIAQKNVLMYPFNAGVKELNHIVQYFNESSFIEQITYLVKENITYDKFLNNITSGNYDIIHIIGNLFFSETNPKNSFFITSDYQIVSISDINNALKANLNHKKSFICFNVRFLNLLGNNLQSNLIVISEIFRNFDQNEITGMIVRNNSIFNEDTRYLLSYIYNNLTGGFNQGVSLLKGRQIYLLNKVKPKSEQEEELKSINMQQDISEETLIALNSFLLFGKPWKMLE